MSYLYDEGNEGNGNNESNESRSGYGSYRSCITNINSIHDIVTVRFQNRDLIRVGVKVKGHSGFDTRGRDTVCAGFSTLFFTFLEMVKKEFGKAEVSESDGWIEIQLVTSSGKIKTESQWLESMSSDNALHYYWAMFISGCELLVTHHPEAFHQEFL